MMKKQLIFWLFVSAISVTLLENMVASVREQKVWEPAREPKTREAAEKLEKESKIKEQEAQKRLEEAQKANDNEEVKKEEVKLNQAKFDLDTAQKKIKYETLLNDPKATPEELRNAQAEIEAKKKIIEQKIQAIETALKQSGTVIGGGSYKEVFEKKFKELAQNQDAMISFMQGELIQLGMGKSKIEFGQKGLLDYADKKEILEVLDKTLASYKDSNPKIVKIKEQIKDTLAQIAFFESDPPKAIPNNVVDAQLKLSEKIYSDQVKAIKRELQASVFDKAYSTVEKQAKALNELRDIINAYAISDEGTISLFNEKILSPTVIEYRIKAAKSLNEVNDIVTQVLKGARVQSVNSPEKYAREANLLENLSVGVTKLGLEFPEVVVGMNDRLNEIKNFKLGQKPRNETELGKELKLSEKIPMDAVAELHAQRGKVIADYEELSKTNKKQALENAALALETIRKNLENYSLVSGKYQDFYESVKRNIDFFKAESAKVPSESPEGTTEQEVAPGGFFDQLLNGTLEQGRQLVLKGIDVVQAGVDYLIVKEIGAIDASVVALQKAGETLEDYGNMLQNAADAVDNSIDLIQTIQDNPLVQQFQEGGVVRKILLIADPKMVDALDKELVSAQNIKDLLQSPLIKNIAEKLKVIGAQLKQTGQIAIPVSELLDGQNQSLKKDVATLSTEVGKQTAEKLAAQQVLERALQRVRQERLAPPMIDAQKVPKSIRQKITSVFTNLAQSIKNIFNKPQGINERLTSTSKNYEQSRVDYLNLLGVPENASQSMINEAIKNNKNIAQTNKLEQRLLASAKEYANVVKDYADVLRGAQSSIKLLVDMPDDLLVPKDFNENLLKQGKLADNINAIFDIREQRLNYLDAIQQESVAFLSSIKQLSAGKSVAGVTDRISENIANLIEGTYLRESANIARQNELLEMILQEQQDSLKKKLSFSPNDTPSSGGQTGGDTDGPKPAGDGGEGYGA